MVITHSKTDFTTSIEKALAEINPDYEMLDGTVATGSHAPKDIHKKLELIREARENNKPFLGICMGMQLAMIEFARNYLHLETANTTEIDEKTPWPIFTKLPSLRVGIRPVSYEGNTAYESHWHNYAFNPQYITFFKKHWKMIWSDDVLEIVVLKDHPFFWGVQFHPEYQSMPDKPHPLLTKFIDACIAE